jgi:hypothetical protein
VSPVAAPNKPLCQRREWQERSYERSRIVADAGSSATATARSVKAFGCANHTLSLEAALDPLISTLRRTRH